VTPLADYLRNHFGALHAWLRGEIQADKRPSSPLSELVRSQCRAVRVADLEHLVSRRPRPQNVPPPRLVPLTRSNDESSFTWTIHNLVLSRIMCIFHVRPAATLKGFHGGLCSFIRAGSTPLNACSRQLQYREGTIAFQDVVMRRTAVMLGFAVLTRRTKGRHQVSDPTCQQALKTTVVICLHC
jgi:hypothetical protein